ncbi:hypothetical protein QLX08_006593 [Tetragonisca angustula]|uniref:Uncharacterized protein n=1 Tax=Tetragonisca angustula TaxID=166442 RepID=A0AAW0ZTF4_9HYME
MQEWGGVLSEDEGMKFDTVVNVAGTSDRCISRGKFGGLVLRVTDNEYSSESRVYPPQWRLNVKSANIRHLDYGTDMKR